MFLWGEIFVPQDNTIGIILPGHTTTILSLPWHLPLLPPCVFPQNESSKDRKKFEIMMVITSHLYRERFKSRRLFFIYGAEDVTMVNRSNSLLPEKRWTDPCICPLSTFSCNFYSVFTSSELCFTPLALSTGQPKFGFPAEQSQTEIRIWCY